MLFAGPLPAPFLPLVLLSGLELDDAAFDDAVAGAAADDAVPDWLCAKASAGTRAISTIRLTLKVSRRDLDEL